LGNIRCKSFILILADIFFILSVLILISNHIQLYQQPEAFAANVRIFYFFKNNEKSDFLA